MHELITKFCHIHNFRLMEEMWKKKFFVAYVVSQVVKISHFNQDSSACFIKAFKLKKAYE